MYFVVFSTNLDWGRTSNGVEPDSIKRSIPERGLDGAWSCWILGHNSAGRSLDLIYSMVKRPDFSFSLQIGLFIRLRKIRMKFININWLSIDWNKIGLLRLNGNRRLNNLGGFFSPFISTEVNLRLSSIRRRRRRHRSSSSLFMWVFRSLWILLSSRRIQRVWSRSGRRGRRRSMSSSLFWFMISSWLFLQWRSSLRNISRNRRINHHTWVWHLREVRLKWDYLFGRSSWIWELWHFRVFISRNMYIW